MSTRYRLGSICLSQTGHHDESKSMLDMVNVVGCGVRGWGIYATLTLEAGAKATVKAERANNVKQDENKKRQRRQLLH